MVRDANTFQRKVYFQQKEGGKKTVHMTKTDDLMWDSPIFDLRDASTESSFKQHLEGCNKNELCLLFVFGQYERFS